MVGSFSSGVARPHRLISPGRRPYIVIGSEKSPLVAQAARALDAPAVPQQAEGYTLVVRGQAAVVAGRDEAGTSYGLQSLRQLLVLDRGSVRLRAARIRDWPQTPFRGIRLYLPGRDNIAFFKRFLRDFMALYKYNRLIVEVNAAMRFDHHPELNAGWIELGENMSSTQRSMLWGGRSTCGKTPLVVLSRGPTDLSAPAGFHLQAPA